MSDQNSGSKYGVVEETKCFSFSNLSSKVKKELLKKNKDIDDDTMRELMHKSFKTFKLNGQTFEYSCQPNYLGGFRWYIKCPICGANSLKLFLPEGKDDREPIYACKKCHRLKNTSALVGSTQRYKKVLKPLKRMEILRKKILRKGITPQMAESWIDEYEALEESLKNSKEYKLWKFQKRFGEI